MTAFDLIALLATFKPDAAVMIYTAEGVEESILTIEADHGPDSNLLYLIGDEA